MKLRDRGNELPIHDIKDYERKFLNSELQFKDQDKKQIPYVIHRMRRSKTNSELYDDRNYIYNENESNNDILNPNQVDYIKKMADVLELEYNYDNGIHYVYRFSLSDMFNIK